MTDRGETKLTLSHMHIPDWCVPMFSSLEKGRWRCQARFARFSNWAKLYPSLNEVASWWSHHWWLHDVTCPFLPVKSLYLLFIARIAIFVVASWGLTCWIPSFGSYIPMGFSLFNSLCFYVCWLHSVASSFLWAKFSLLLVTCCFNNCFHVGFCWLNG